MVIWGWARMEKWGARGQKGLAVVGWQVCFSAMPCTRPAQPVLSQCSSIRDRVSPSWLCSLCVHVHACVCACMQQPVPVTATGETGIQGQLLIRLRVWAGCQRGPPHSLVDLHPSPLESGAGQGPQCCPCSCEHSGCLSDPCVWTCVQVRVWWCVCVFCACLPTGNASPASLLAGPRDVELSSLASSKLLDPAGYICSYTLFPTLFLTSVTSPTSCSTISTNSTGIFLRNDRWLRKTQKKKI